VIGRNAPLGDNPFSKYLDLGTGTSRIEVATGTGQRSALSWKFISIFEADLPLASRHGE